KVRQAREEAESELHELLGRLARLRRQESVLQSKGAELFERGMQEDRDEERAIERQQVVGEAQSLGASGLIDWDAVGLELGLPSLADPGSSDGTGQQVAGSSSGS